MKFQIVYKGLIIWVFGVIMKVLKFEGVIFNKIEDELEIVEDLFFITELIV